MAKIIRLSRILLQSLEQRICFVTCRKDSLCLLHVPLCLSNGGQISILTKTLKYFLAHSSQPGTLSIKDWWVWYRASFESLLRSVRREIKIESLRSLTWSVHCGSRSQLEPRWKLSLLGRGRELMFLWRELSCLCALVKGSCTWDSIPPWTSPPRTSCRSWSARRTWKCPNACWLLIAIDILLLWKFQHVRRKTTTWHGEVSLPSLDADTTIWGCTSKPKSLSSHSDLPWWFLWYQPTQVQVTRQDNTCTAPQRQDKDKTKIKTKAKTNTRQYLHGAPKQFIVEAGRASFPHSWEGARHPRSHSQETDLRDLLKFKSRQYFLMKYLFRSMKVVERVSHLCWVPPPQVTEHWEGQVDDISHHHHHHHHHHQN